MLNDCQRLPACLLLQKDVHQKKVVDPGRARVGREGDLNGGLEHRDRVFRADLVVLVCQGVPAAEVVVGARAPTMKWGRARSLSPKSCAISSADQPVTGPS